MENKIRNKTNKVESDRIVRLSDFQKLYAYEDEVNNNGQSVRVYLIKEGSKNIKDLNKPVLELESSIRKCDYLSKLAYDILKLSSSNHSVVIKRNRSEIIRTEKSSQQKTVYRFLSNEDLGVEPPPVQKSKDSQHRKIKLGRPRKRTIEDESVSEDILPHKKNIVKQSFDSNEHGSIDNPKEATLHSIRSRFGRVIKPVKNLLMHTGTQCDSKPDLVIELKDKNFRCSLKSSQTNMTSSESQSQSQSDSKSDKHEEEATPVPIACSSPTKRHVPPEAICPTCKKVFLGRRLKRHFVSHPDHMNPQTPNKASEQSESNTEEISLFRFLISKIQKSNLNEDQRADLFLHELNDLVEQLQLRSSRLIRNTSGLHLVTPRTARVLGIPEGQYALDMTNLYSTAIDATPEPESCLMNFDVSALPVPSNNTRSLDYTALSLDDTLNLSAGGKLLPPSEESLLRVVEDLVPPTKLVDPANLLGQPEDSDNTTAKSNAATLVPHYDHASDNAVEAVHIKECNNRRQSQPILDLPVDFFQFNTNK